MKLKKYFTPKNIAAVALAPITGGASLALLEDGNGKNILKSGIDELTGAKSAREQNEKNRELQEEINNQNIAMQKETNETTIDLANTAHQREVADLQKAGLNPVLSAGGTGAITPTLGTAQAIAPQVQNEMPGGYLAQIGQVANIANLAGSALQAKEQAKLNSVQAQTQPAIAKAQIAADFANAGSAKAQADYTKIMTQVDQELKDAQAQEHYANAYRTKNLSKGEQTREWVKTISNGIGAIAGGVKGLPMTPLNVSSNSNSARWINDNYGY